MGVTVENKFEIVCKEHFLFPFSTDLKFET
jgi:hypothetical protein